MTLDLSKLYPCDREVVEMVCQDALSIKEIAFRSEGRLTASTIRTYLSRAFQKLGVANQQEMIVAYWKDRYGIRPVNAKDFE